MIGKALSRRSAVLAIVVRAAWGVADAGKHGHGKRSPDMLPRDFHNFFCIAVICMLLAWLAKVVYKLLHVANLKTRLAQNQALRLENLSIYASDFQMLIRQHFNQILRIRRTVPSKPVDRHAVSIHLHPESVAVWTGQDGPSATEEDDTSARFGIQFTVDAMVPCCVKLFWGVSIDACNKLVQAHQNGTQAPKSGRWNGSPKGKNVKDGTRGRGFSSPGAGDSSPSRWSRSATGYAGKDAARSLLEMEELNGAVPPGGNLEAESEVIFSADQCFAQSRDLWLPAGIAHRYATPAGDLVSSKHLPFDLSAAWIREGQASDDAAVIPLAIVIIAQHRPSHQFREIEGRPVGEAHVEISFLKFKKPEGDGVPRQAEVFRQLTFGSRVGVFDVRGMFGFEEEGDDECMICYSRTRNVLLLPCRHCSVCHQCLRSLRDEKCPLCRSVFSAHVTLPLRKANLTLETVPQSVATVPQQSARVVPPAPPAPLAPPPAGLTEACGGGLSTGTNADACAEDSIGNKPTATFQGSQSVVVSRPPIDSCGSTEGSRETEPIIPGSIRASAGTASNCNGTDAARPAETSRQARELHLGRPRGVASSRASPQSLLRSGRARFRDRMGNSDTGVPLLQEGGSSVVAPLRSADTDNCVEDAELLTVSNKQTGVEASAAEPVEETHVLIQEGDSV